MSKRRAPRGARVRPKPSSSAQNDVFKADHKTSSELEASRSEEPLKTLESNQSVNDSVLEARPLTSSPADDKPYPPTSSATAALYDELDSFRQRWKREIQTKKPVPDKSEQLYDESKENIDNPRTPANVTVEQAAALKDSFEAMSIGTNDPRQMYSLAKKIFLIGAELERNELHHESIRYYKQAIHLYPDIEKQLFREQCQLKTNEKAEIDKKSTHDETDTKTSVVDIAGDLAPLYRRIQETYCDGHEGDKFAYCKPTNRHKTGTFHISQLPHDILMQIVRYVIGQQLDLASLETMGLVCRGFFLLSRDQYLWKSICYRTWGGDLPPADPEWKDDREVEWRSVFMHRPRVNYDGIYISRTRYIRHGDVGFQDLVYRPFHVIRYYRYLRFFPDKRVLILTTNEEPERIVPIFRHALYAKQFSPELSILEGCYEFDSPGQVRITAMKDCRAVLAQMNQNKRRQVQQNSRQTPLSQKFEMKFELLTNERKSYRNNTLTWDEYSITSKYENGDQEITNFDLSPDTFPSLTFARVRNFNMRLTSPLSVSDM